MTGLRQTDNLQPDPRAAAGGMSCQWCSVALPAGETVCPTCHSPGIPDPKMTAPGIEILEPASPEPSDPAKQPDELDEWWLDDEPETQDVTRAQPAPVLDEDRVIKMAAIRVTIAPIF